MIGYPMTPVEKLKGCEDAFKMFVYKLNLLN